MLVIISPRSDREATAGTLFQFIVYRNKKGKTRDGLAQSFFITLYQYYKILPVRENFKTGQTYKYKHQTTELNLLP